MTGVFSLTAVLTVLFFISEATTSDASARNLVTGVSRVLDDGSEEYTVTISTPNVTLVNDYVFICVAAEVPSLDGDASSYIVKVRPHPVPGIISHLNIRVCSMPGNQVLPEKPEAWECGSDYVFAGRNPPLASGHECMHADDTVSYGHMQYQYQGGSVDEAALTLSPGFGVPVGGKSDPKYMVFDVHYPSPRETMDGTTGSAHIDVTLVRKPITAPKIVSSLSLLVNGFLAADSIARLTGSWTLTEDKEIKLLLLYPHTHTLGIGIEMEIVRKDGEHVLLLSRDPRTQKGIVEVEDRASGVMRPGDRLAIHCTYNNTKPQTVRVEAGEHCTSTIYYSVQGNQTLETVEVFSNDGYYKKCFIDLSVPGVVSNFEAVSEYRGPVSDKECFVW